MRLTILSVAILFLATPMMAAASATQVYTSGSMSFAYDEFPVGPYSGSFNVTGNVNDAPTFPPEGTGACVAFRIEAGSFNSLLIMGGVQVGAGLMDAAFLLIESAQPLAPGTYALDPVGQTVMFGFIDDGVNLMIPQSRAAMDPLAWFNGVEVGRAFLGVSGSITLTSVLDGYIEATFDGLVAEVGGETVANLTGGHVTVNTPPVSVAEQSWGAIKNLYQE